MTRISHRPQGPHRLHVRHHHPFPDAALFDDDGDGPPQIAFAPHAEGYAGKPDFAGSNIAIHCRPPTCKRSRHRTSPDQEQVDQIYACLSAGPIP